MFKGSSGPVPSHPDHSSGHVSDKLVPGGEESGVRSAVKERDPETLRRADGDVDAELARRLKQRQRHQVGRANRQRLKDRDA